MAVDSGQLSIATSKNPSVGNTIYIIYNIYIYIYIIYVLFAIVDCSLIAALLFAKTEDPTTGFLDEPHKVFDDMQERNPKMISK